MCDTCGCMKPAWKHGSDKNITRSKLKAAAMSKAGPKNIKKAVKNVVKTEKAIASGKISPSKGANLNRKRNGNKGN